MNKLIQTVTLGADPTVKTYGDGKTCTTFSGAVKRRYSKEGETDTDWFNYTAFGSTADFIAKYFHKGSKMLIIGSPQNNNYTKEDGTKVYRDQIIVDQVEFFGSKSDGNVKPNQQSTDGTTTEPKADSAPETSAYEAYDDF